MQRGLRKSRGVAGDLKGDRLMTGENPYEGLLEEWIEEWRTSGAAEPEDFKTTDRLRVTLAQLAEQLPHIASVLRWPDLDGRTATRVMAMVMLFEDLDDELSFKKAVTILAAMDAQGFFDELEALWDSALRTE
jgi:hypothetical protein